MQLGIVIAAFVLTAGSTFAQKSVCELFRDLPANDGARLIITGDLLISKDLTALGAADCDHRYVSDHHQWPTAISLQPAPGASGDQLRRIKDAAVEADRLRLAGKTVNASATFAGRLRVAPVSDFPAELIFESLEDMKVEALPDAAGLPVISICDLFQSLPATNGLRFEESFTAQEKPLVSRAAARVGSSRMGTGGQSPSTLEVPPTIRKGHPP